MFAQINAERESEILLILNKVNTEVPDDLKEKIDILTQLFSNECKPTIEQYITICKNK